MGVAASNPTGHVSDGDLVRLLDGAVHGGAHQSIEVHVSKCPNCAARLDRLRTRSTRLSSLLSAQPVVEWLPSMGLGRMVVPTTHRKAQPRRDFHWSAAAAAVVLVASTAVAAGPARDWIVNGARTLLGRSAARPSVPPPERPTVSSSTVAVTFAPEADEVLFWLDATPSGGTLELHVAGDGRTTAEIARGQASEEIVVVPNGIRVRNGPASVADYRVTVGRMGARVRLRVGPAGATRDTVFTAASQFTRIDLRAIRSR